MLASVTKPVHVVPVNVREALSTCLAERSSVRGNTESQSEAKSLLRPKLALQVMFPPHMAGNELPVKLLGLQFNVPDTCNPASKQNARSVSIDVSLPGTETSRVACFKRTRRQRIETV